MKIACVGQCVIDLSFPIDSSIIENKKYRVKDMSISIGGPAANASFVNGSWKQNTIIVGRVGNDDFGKKIKREFEAINVDTSYLFISNQNTSISSIILSNGNRTIFNHSLIDEGDNIDIPDDIDVILVDGHELEASIKIINKNPKALSIMDGGTYKPHLKDLLAVVNYLVVSEDFAEQYTNFKIDLTDKKKINETFNLLKKLNKNNIVITLGERGLLFEDQNEIKYLPAYKVNVVDSSGAGDIFHGAFAYGIANKFKYVNILKFASAAAALSVTRKGSNISIPSLDEVKKFIKEH